MSGNVKSVECGLPLCTGSREWAGDGTERSSLSHPERITVKLSCAFAFTTKANRVAGPLLNCPDLNKIGGLVNGWLRLAADITSLKYFKVKWSRGS